MRLIQEEQNDQSRPEYFSNDRTHDGRNNWPPPDNKTIHKVQFGVSGLKRVAWPPTSTEEHLVPISRDQAVKSQNTNQQQSRFYEQQQQQFNNNEKAALYNQQQQQHQQQQQQQNYNPAQNQNPSRFSPVITNNQKQWSSVSSPTPSSASPLPQRPPQNSAGYQSPNALYNQNTSTPPHTQQHYQTEQEIYQQQQQQQIVRPQATQPQRHFEPPPQTITLRTEVPMSQKPAPVYNAQPAAKVFKGGSFLRGDLKWPPPEVKTRMEDEKKQLEDLAKGPACRPRKHEKDYTEFFAQNALSDTYPGYKVPPGTLYYPHEPKYIKLS